MSELFGGVSKIGTIYPLVFLAYGLAAIVGPMIGGLFFDITGSYSVALLIGVVICFLAFLIYFIFMPKPQIEEVEDKEVVGESVVD